MPKYYNTINLKSGFTRGEEILLTKVIFNICPQLPIEIMIMILRHIGFKAKWAYMHQRYYAFFILMAQELFDEMPDDGGGVRFCFMSAIPRVISNELNYVNERLRHIV